MNLENFFDPKSVAVIGASADKTKVGFSLVLNLLGGKKREIYPVTLTEKEILGLPAFASVSNIPANIDLAIIAVRADIVPQILADCGRKQIPGAIIISSGFKEMGETGKALEDQIAKIATEQNISLLGPNCLGVISTKSDFNASFSVQKPLSGKIALLSQSGALGTAMLDWAVSEGVGFSKFISLGNETMLNEIDFLKYLESDEDTNAILIYLEKVNAGAEFMRLLKSITTKKPVIILKAGVSSYGASAIMSHTGSLAPESSVFSSACKQAGAIIVPSLRKFFNMSKLLSLGVNISQPVRQLVVLTNGGGPSVIAADEIGLSHSLSLFELDENTKEALRKVLPTTAAVGNPIDIIGDALAERYEKALEILCAIKEIDGIIVMLTPQMMTETETTAKLLTKYKENKKIFPVFMGGPSVQSGRLALIQSGLVNFAFSKDVITGLDTLANNAPKLELSSGSRSLADESIKQMPFSDTSKLLGDYNISVSGKFAAKKEDLITAISSCGDGPYAMKAISSAIVHKTDSGAVKLNISNIEEAILAWEEMERKILTQNPEAEIEGVLVQSMAVGREVIIGMKRDVTFGPTILFGLGGILAEAIKDTTLRIAPVEKVEALKMMQEIKGIKILQGMRGQPPVNFDLLADIIVNLSRLAIEHSEIKEIDLNPVMVTENSATIVDARMMK
jgi:acetate---CoA ligase (ADP-forming)